MVKHDAPLSLWSCGGRSGIPRRSQSGLRGSVLFTAACRCDLAVDRETFGATATQRAASRATLHQMEDGPTATSPLTIVNQSPAG